MIKTFFNSIAIVLILRSENIICINANEVDFQDMSKMLDTSMVNYQKLHHAEFRESDVLNWESDHEAQMKMIVQQVSFIMVQRINDE